MPSFKGNLLRTNETEASPALIAKAIRQGQVGVAEGSNRLTKEQILQLDESMTQLNASITWVRRGWTVKPIKPIKRKKKNQEEDS